MEDAIIAKAKELGFLLCSFTSSFEPLHENYFQNWVKDGKFGQMSYLSNNTDKRLSPDLIFPDTKSAIVVACSYSHHEKSHEDYEIARYAYGEDYHRWMKTKLEALAVHIKEKFVFDFKWRSFVDTGPVLERDLANQAGLGWIGKNTCLIHPTHGSYIFLGVLFCNYDFKSHNNVIADQCGSCSLCIEACPTQAIDDYQMDARKCLSYLNIEMRGPKDNVYYKDIDNHLVGCDICQEVCPYNLDIAHEAETNWLKTFRKFDLGDLKNILKMSASQYKKSVKHSAISRVRYLDFMRTVFLVIANTKRVDLKNEVIEWQRLHSDSQLEELDYCLNVLK